MYPKMHIQDIVKLIFQNEFGGGHLITDIEKSLKKLEEECSLISECSSPSLTINPFESIGNDLFRINLCALEKSSISLSTINKFFVNTADSVKGSVKSFEEKLSVFEECCKEGELPFSLDILKSYLSNYKNQGYPPVSHSIAYHNAYSPSYRIISKCYIDYLDIFAKIDKLMSENQLVKIAIDGNSGSGKSTLSSIISLVYDCNVFHMDDFFLRPEMKTKERLNEIGGNVDYERFLMEVILGLESGKPFEYTPYDCKQQALIEPVKVIPKKLNVIEGSYSMHPTLIQYYDLKVFMQIDENTQAIRILKRNGPFLQKRFLKEWIPLENIYFREMKIKDKCDIVISHI